VSPVLPVGLVVELGARLGDLLVREVGFETSVFRFACRLALGRVAAVPPVVAAAFFLPKTLPVGVVSAFFLSVGEFFIS
jgi:hypothetical protein